MEAKESNIRLTVESSMFNYAETRASVTLQVAFFKRKSKARSQPGSRGLWISLIAKAPHSALLPKLYILPRMSWWKPEPHKYCHSCSKCLLDSKVTYRTHLLFDCSIEPLCWKWRQGFWHQGSSFSLIFLSQHWYPGLLNLVNSLLMSVNSPSGRAALSLHPCYKRYQESFWSG